MVTMKLKNKTAIITGGASGIGKATALLFAKEGANVVIADIDERNGKNVEVEANKIKSNLEFVKCDVTKINDVRNLVSKAIKRHGKIDIIFNNAGIYQENKFLHELPEDIWDMTINTNLKSIFLCSKYVIPHMIKNKYGVIINNASELGIVVEPESPAYCASKAAVIHLTKVMALEYADHNIRVNCVCPGPIDTPLLRRSFRTEKDVRNYMKNHTLFRRLGRPEEVANVVLFLASDDTSYITGAAYSIDGGESLR